MAGAKMGLGGGLSNLFGSDTSDLMEESLDNGTKNLPLAKIEPRIGKIVAGVAAAELKYRSLMVVLMPGFAACCTASYIENSRPSV